LTGFSYFSFLCCSYSIFQKWTIKVLQANWRYLCDLWSVCFCVSYEYSTTTVVRLTCRNRACDSKESVRLTELTQIISTYQSYGILELIPGRPRSVAEYQTCCVHLQATRSNRYRHFLFVSGQLLFTSSIQRYNYNSTLCSNWTDTFLFQIAINMSILKIIQNYNCTYW